MNHKGSLIDEVGKQVFVLMWANIVAIVGIIGNFYLVITFKTAFEKQVEVIKSYEKQMKTRELKIEMEEKQLELKNSISDNMTIQHEGGEPLSAKEDEDETKQDENKEQDPASNGDKTDQDGEKDN